MNVISKPTRYESLAKETHSCPCCGLPQQFIGGMVYDQYDDLLADFVGALQEHLDGHRWVGFRMALKLVDDTGAMLEAKTFTLVLNNRDGVFGTSVATGPHDPTGLSLTREEALKSPFLSLIFEIDDFIADKDPFIRPFLRCPVSE